MTFKENLQNRVRGWFPQEPYRISNKIKVHACSEHKQPPLAIPLGYDLSATKWAGCYAVFWISLTSLNMLFSSEGHLILNIFDLFWLIGGFVIGVILGLVIPRNQLNRLSIEYKINPNRKEIIFLIGSLSIFLAVRFLFFFWFPISFMLIFASLLALGCPILLFRYVLFYAYEKKENMRLVQSGGEEKFTLFLKLQLRAN
jgi:hypothetical protein